MCNDKRFVKSQWWKLHMHKYQPLTNQSQELYWRTLTWNCDSMSSVVQKPPRATFPPFRPLSLMAFENKSTMSSSRAPHTYFQECISKVAIFFTLDLLMSLFCSDLQLITSWLTLRKSFKVSWNFNFFWHILGKENNFPWESVTVY